MSISVDPSSPITRPYRTVCCYGLPAQVMPALMDFRISGCLETTRRYNINFVIVGPILRRLSPEVVLQSCGSLSCCLGCLLQFSNVFEMSARIFVGAAREQGINTSKPGSFSSARPQNSPGNHPHSRFTTALKNDLRTSKIKLKIRRPSVAHCLKPLQGG